MIRKSFSSVIALGIALTFLLTIISQAQPLAKRNIKTSLNERTHQTLIPINYNNHKLTGPSSKTVFKHYSKNVERISNSSVKEKSQKNIFRLQKLHNAYFTSGSRLNSSTEGKFVSSTFSRQKRHQ